MLKNLIKLSLAAQLATTAAVSTSAAESYALKIYVSQLQVKDKPTSGDTDPEESGALQISPKILIFNINSEPIPGLKTVQITNKGKSATSVSIPGYSAWHRDADNVGIMMMWYPNCPAVLQPEESCDVQVKVEPAMLPFGTSRSTIPIGSDAKINTLEVQTIHEGGFIVWDTPTVSFGKIPAGTTKTIKVKATNIGNSPGYFNSTWGAVPPFFYRNNIPLLNRGESAHLDLVIDTNIGPANLGEFSGVLKASSASSLRSGAVRVSGEVVPQP